MLADTSKMPVSKLGIPIFTTGLGALTMTYPRILRRFVAMVYAFRDYRGPLVDGEQLLRYMREVLVCVCTPPSTY